jgi:hypothetical protein
MAAVRSTRIAAYLQGGLWNSGQRHGSPRREVKNKSNEVFSDWTSCHKKQSEKGYLEVPGPLASVAGPMISCSFPSIVWWAQMDGCVNHACRCRDRMYYSSTTNSVC